MRSTLKRNVLWALSLLGVFVLAGCGAAPQATVVPAVATGAAQIATLTAVETATASAPTSTPGPVDVAAQIEGAWASSNWLLVIDLLKRQSPINNDKLYAAYFNLCQQQLSKGNKTEAIKACQDALAINATGSEARQVLLSLTPRPLSTETPATPLTEAESVAISVLSSRVLLIANALSDLRSLTSNPRPSDEGWKNQMVIPMATIKAAHQSIMQLNAPGRTATLRTLILNATADCSAAMDGFAKGIDDLSASEINSANNLILSCGAKLTPARIELDKLKP